MPNLALLSLMVLLCVSGWIFDELQGRRGGDH